MAVLHNVLEPLPGGRTRTQAVAGTQFNTKARPDHWGTDLRATVWDTHGDDVLAPCDMRLIAAGIGDGSASARIKWHSGRFQYWDMGLWGGDRMYLYLGHLYAHVGGTKYLRAVDAGRHIAEMGGSGVAGRDTFIDHLHIGVAVNTTNPQGLFRNGQGWIDPVKWFARHGVNFNTTHPAGADLILNEVPVSKPAPVAPIIIPKEWSDMASKAEVEQASYEGAKRARDEKNVPWTDSVTGNVTMITEAEALGNLSVLNYRDGNVPWTDSVTGRVTSISKAKALGNMSVLEYRRKQAELAAAEGEGEA